MHISASNLAVRQPNCPLTNLVILNCARNIRVGHQGSHRDVKFSLGGMVWGGGQLDCSSPYFAPFPLWNPQYAGYNKQRQFVRAFSWAHAMYRTARIVRAARPGALGRPQRTHDIFRSSGSRMRYSYLHFLAIFYLNICKFEAMTFQLSFI